MSPEELVRLASSKGIKRLALTDINCSSAIPQFVEYCQKYGVAPVAGIDFRARTGAPLIQDDGGNNEVSTQVELSDGPFGNLSKVSSRKTVEVAKPLYGQQLYVGLAQSHEGLYQLNQWLTDLNLSQQELPLRPPVLPHVYWLYPFEAHPSPSSLGPQEYVMIKPWQLSHLVRHPLTRYPAKLILCQPVTFALADDYGLHCHLRAIDHNLLLSQLTPEMVSHQKAHFPDKETMLKLRAEHGQLLKNAEALLDRCHLSFDLETPKNRSTYTGDIADDQRLLRKLAQEGMVKRYGQNHPVAMQRLEHELGIICRMGFTAYFLITWDIIRYSMSRGYYHVGRGSGANSLVAYCLYITDVDPITLDLYFERFLNPKRTSAPDFDIDYSWQDRDDVHHYIFDRYKHTHTALLGTSVTFQGRSILRELGKVYGLPKGDIDRIVNEPAHQLNQTDLIRHIERIGVRMDGMPSLRSIHAGGVLISERPITYYSALDLPPKGLGTVQWDMYEAERLGLDKYDILSQRGIGHIKDAVEIISQNRGIRVDVHDVSRIMADQAVADQLYKGDTIGCFYIESPAMRQLLKKLHCRTYQVLVAASSIIRPGVSSSGMMQQYIWRFHHQDQVQYLHPVFEAQLGETFGVMVYQEDVLKICHHFAGMDLGDADILRRAMSGKYRSKDAFNQIRDLFFSQAIEKGHDEALVGEVWRQISSFGGYSFCKAHSASFAVESFQSLMLKTYYPIEFMVGVINNFGGFYQTWLYVHECQRSGGIIHLPCVNNSQVLTSVNGKDVYLGFIHIKGLEKAYVQQIGLERASNGQFKSLEDFIDRIPLSLEQLRLLVRVGAFRFTGLNKKQLMMQARLLLSLGAESDRNHLYTNQMLFAPPRTSYELPVPRASKLEDAFDEIDLLGFPVSVPHFALLKTQWRSPIKVRDLSNYVGQRIKLLGKLVTYKTIRTRNNQFMTFGTFIDPDGDFFDTVHFPQVLKQWPLTGGGIYLIEGIVVSEFSFCSLEVEKCARLPIHTPQSADEDTVLRIEREAYRLAS